MEIATNQVSANDQAITILGGTHDGNDLAPRDLALIQTVVNYGLDSLTPEGQAYWANLYKTVADKTYVKPWFHGQEHLTKDHEGYVYWKGIRIEHYSFHGDWEAEAISAKELAAVCREIERRGQVVSWSACSRIYSEARFGEGMVTPRFHVSWFFNETTALLDVTEEDSTSINQLEVNTDAVKAANKLAWNCDENAIRHMQINCKEDLAACLDSLRSDDQWSRQVLRRSHVSGLIDQLHKKFADNKLADANVLSGYVLARVGEDSLRSMISELNECFALVRAMGNQQELEKQALVYGAFLSDVEAGNIKRNQKDVPAMVSIIKDFCKLIRTETSAETQRSANQSTIPQ